MSIQYFSKRRITETPELRRIKNLPTRTWSDADANKLASDLTELLKTPQGKWKLRTVQAIALYEMGTYGGLFGPIRVGGGKTLTTLLAPYVLEAKRPILLLPAALIEKTERERRELAKHWRIPVNLRIMSYEMLGRVQAAETLTFYKPDLIISDESHKLKNKRAGVTRRVARYMREHPDTKFVALSGTVMKGSIRDFAHILRWCLKDGAPIPKTEGELEEWADSLDEKVNPLNRINPGPLTTLAPAMGADELQVARRAFQARLCSTPGVVATKAGEDVDCSLYIRALKYDVSPITDKHFHTLRSKWETPDGWALSEAVGVWRHSRELAIGLHYAWSPRPPEEWVNRRREWAAFVRETLSHSRTLDTELQVAMACDAGQLDGEALRAWRAVRDTFKPNPVPCWHDDSALLACEAWMKQGPGIVWCEHVFFAEELSKRTGVPYFGANGVDKTGLPIEKADPTKPLIASIAANSTGRNLQAWSRNLITACPTGAAQWEQLLGRTHRDGQQADQVEVDLLIGCAEHIDGWTRALSAAAASEDTLGHTQKLLVADKLFPSTQEMSNYSGARFQRNYNVEKLVL